MQFNKTKLFPLSALFLSVVSASSFAAPTNDPKTVVFKPLKNAKGVIISKPKHPSKQKRRVKRNTLLQDSINTNDWFNLNPEQDSIEGSNINKVYNNLHLNNSNPPIIVAVIDSGIDIHHEDLQGKMWVNNDEIPDNGIDDDNNGYIDDIHGWNFIGGSDGSQVTIDTKAVTREYARYKA
ncbi:S8/S53 family peptidase [Spartinivicinus ruber]|uniref:S8 family serine peptidase n=1 Tax=Spartinivicinus ruber TaxID=2683272 RepID=UPI0013D83EBF|nr:S8 family serine peptidase [Spartinivicinus ruber]